MLRLIFVLFFLVECCFAGPYLCGQISQNMTLEATWNGNTISRSGNFYNDCWGYVDALGNEYAIIGSPQKIHFVDISNPKAPILKNEFSGGSASLWRDMKTYACYAYAVADEGQEGLIIFDLKALPSGDIVKTYQKTTDFRRAHNILSLIHI